MKNKLIDIYVKIIISFYNEKFYICSCNKYICPLCINKHNKGHKNIEYQKRFYFCQKHCLKYKSYCNKCNSNLCSLCENDHKKHEIILYKSKKPTDKKVNEINYDLKEFIQKLEDYKKEVQKLNEIFSDFIPNIIKNLDNYIKLYTNIFNSFIISKNYESLRNIFYFKMKKIIREINILYNQENNKNKLKYLLDTNYSTKNEMIIKYKLNLNDSNIRIFGNKFVQNNIDKCFLIIDNKIRWLCEFYIYDKNKLNENNESIINIKIVEKIKIRNLGYMFYDCSNLIGFVGLESWNTNNVTDMSNMFGNCISLKEIPDISQWNTSNVTNISGMFFNCSQLTTLPDISKWRSKSVIDIYALFEGCSSIKTLPDISQWNVSKVNNFSGLFHLCSSLVSLPDLSKWNTSNIIYMRFLFSDCSSLISLPDISNWNTNRVIYMNNIFSSCISLQTIPDISKWNTSNFMDLSYMFFSCSSLISLPDISNWNISKVVDISYMFYNCSSLTFLPDISKWSTLNAVNMSYLFFWLQIFKIFTKHLKVGYK